MMTSILCPSKRLRHGGRLCCFLLYVKTILGAVGPNWWDALGSTNWYGFRGKIDMGRIKIRWNRTKQGIAESPLTSHVLSATSGFDNCNYYTVYKYMLNLCCYLRHECRCYCTEGLSFVNLNESEPYNHSRWTPTGVRQTASLEKS